MLGNIGNSRPVWDTGDSRLEKQRATKCMWVLSPVEHEMVYDRDFRKWSRTDLMNRVTVFPEVSGQVGGSMSWR